MAPRPLATLTQETDLTPGGRLPSILVPSSCRTNGPIPPVTRVGLTRPKLPPALNSLGRVTSKTAQSLDNVPLIGALSKVTPPPVPSVEVVPAAPVAVPPMSRVLLRTMAWKVSFLQRLLLCRSKGQEATYIGTPLVTVAVTALSSLSPTLATSWAPTLGVNRRNLPR